MSPLSLDIHSQSWPIDGGFAIARGTKSTAEVIVVSVGDGQYVGYGESVPYGRYGETMSAVRAELGAVTLPVGMNTSKVRQFVQSQLRAGAARNALDCALWDLQAKQEQTTCAALAGLSPLANIQTAHSIGLGTAAHMAQKAAQLHQFPLLKLKLDGTAQDQERMSAVRQARPDAQIIVDANEAWRPENLPVLMAHAATQKIALIEQPLPADDDMMLAQIERSVVICADESAHISADLERLADRYDAVNIKLDKTGGLSEALAMVKATQDAGMGLMVGCMVATSLAMAPAILIAQSADWVDLDGPLLLRRDREPALRYDGPWLSPASPQLWG